MCYIDKGGALGTGLSPKLTWRMTQTRALRRCPCEGQHSGSAPCAVLFPSLWCFSLLSNLSVVDDSPALPGFASVPFRIELAEWSRWLGAAGLPALPPVCSVCFFTSLSFPRAFHWDCLMSSLCRQDPFSIDFFLPFSADFLQLPNGNRLLTARCSLSAFSHLLNPLAPHCSSL